MHTTSTAFDDKPVDGYGLDSKTSVEANPPPPYNGPAQSSASHHPNEKSTSKQHAIPNPYDPGTPAISYQLRYKSLRDCKIMQGNETEPRYIMRSAKTKLHFNVTSPSTGQELGSLKVPWTSTTFTTNVNGNSITLHNNGWFKNGHYYYSPALEGQKLTWKLRASDLDLICVNEQNVLLAAFQFKCFSLKKVGDVQIFPTAAEQQELMDELLMTALTMATYVYVARTSPFTIGAS